MPKIEGIIYKVFNSYIVLRGYAPIRELAKISKPSEAYQRKANNEHKKDIIKFLDGGGYKFFPELVLAYRIENYTEIETELNTNYSDVSPNDVDIKNIKILAQRIPISGSRARHAYLTINYDDHNLLKRIDGNHRLEPFDETDEWWWSMMGKKVPDDVAPENQQQWISHQVRTYRSSLDIKMVPFCILLSDNTDVDTADAFEAGIFNNINFKQLPLRFETNLRNVFQFPRLREDSINLDKYYPLTWELIQEADKFEFKGIPLLTPYSDNNKDTYRTACYRIAKLLIEKKEVLTQKKEEIETKISDFEQTEIDINEKIANLSTELMINISSGLDCEETIKIDIKNQLKKIYDLVNIEASDINKISEAISNIRKIPNNNIKELIDFQEELIDIDFHKKRLDLRLREIDTYISIIAEKDFNQQTNINPISEAMQSLIPTYRDFGRNYGTISMLSILVYYRLSSISKFNNFIDWIRKTNYHTIITQEDSPKQNSEDLMTLFESIYEMNKREVFISMQFGDPQSEMIYEKILQIIEKFNNKDKEHKVKVTPIRIDRTLDPHTFTISDKILEAIKNSSLIIADLSSGNKNVYHEIGYAMGIAAERGIQPPVILLYKENSEHKKDISIDNFVGFNLRGYSQLRFRTYEELTTGLENRLKRHFAL